MKVQDLRTGTDFLRKTSPKKQRAEEVGLKFEQLFARQLVQEMTKGLFEGGDNKGMIGNAGSDIYREHIIDALSKELAKNQDLGIGKKIAQYLNERVE